MSEEEPVITMSDYTSLWKVKRTLYSIGKDFALPAPIYVETFIIGLVVFPTWFLIAIPLFGIQLWEVIVPIVITVVVTKVLNKPIFSGRGAFSSLLSLLKYWSVPKEADNLRTPKREESKTLHLTSSVFFPGVR